MLEILDNIHDTFFADAPLALPIQSFERKRKIDFSLRDTKAFAFRDVNFYRISILLGSAGRPLGVACVAVEIRDTIKPHPSAGTKNSGDHGRTPFAGESVSTRQIA